jgi:hypothetical protein
LKNKLKLDPQLHSLDKEISDRKKKSHLSVKIYEKKLDWGHYREANSLDVDDCLAKSLPQGVRALQ